MSQCSAPWVIAWHNQWSWPKAWGCGGKKTWGVFIPHKSYNWESLSAWTKLRCHDKSVFYSLHWNVLQVKEVGVSVEDCSCLAQDASRIFGVYWELGAQKNSSLPPYWPGRFSALSSIKYPLTVKFNGVPARVYLSVSSMTLLSSVSNGCHNCTQYNIHMPFFSASKCGLESLPYFKILLPLYLQQFTHTVWHSLSFFDFHWHPLHEFLNLWYLTVSGRFKDVSFEVNVMYELVDCEHGTVLWTVGD